VAADMWDAVKPHPPGRRVAAARRVKSRIEQTGEVAPVCGVFLFAASFWASVNHFTLGGEKICEPLSVSSMGNANARMDNNWRRSRDRRDLVGRRDVGIGPCGVGFGRDIAAC
jgi:hypothetical protein